MTFARPFRLTLHPHGHVHLSRSLPLALLRISKNASTSLKRHPALDLDLDWVPVRDVPDRVEILSVVRDPWDRFLSSIPETLSRLRSDVVVSRDVEDLLSGVETAPGASIIALFIDLVRHQAFDAHHEPQVHFLTDIHGRAEGHFRLGLMEDAEAFINAVVAGHGGEPRAMPQLNVSERMPTEMDQDAAAAVVRAAMWSAEIMRDDNARQVVKTFFRDKVEGAARAMDRPALEALKTAVRTLYEADQALVAAVAGAGLLGLEIPRGAPLL